MKINSHGWITEDASIRLAPRHMIEHGSLKTIKGIIVHQTGSPSAVATLNGYKNPNANGAHFLIDKDGTTYQVASLKRKTWHVGKLKAKCLELHTCSTAEIKAINSFNVSKINRMETQKSIPLRFPSNNDSIGIELVGSCVLDPKFIRPGMTPTQLKILQAQKGVYEKVTPAQNMALDSIIRKIQSVFGVPDGEIFPHSQVSWKNTTEGMTARWPGKK